MENAVRHGIARRPGPGRIRISAHRQGADLLLLVTDSGVGLGPGQHIEGVGLSNTKARLSELYGPTSRVTLENAEGSGALATIKLPFHREQEVIYAEFTTGIAPFADWRLPARGGMLEVKIGVRMVSGVWTSVPCTRTGHSVIFMESSRKFQRTRTPSD